jgi:hypothetical protein
MWRTSRIPRPFAVCLPPRILDAPVLLQLKRAGPKRLPGDPGTIQRGMPHITQNPLHRPPPQTALWLSRLSIGLLLGTALWLMGVRLQQNKVALETFPTPKAETLPTQPTQ